jgi:hypothetical protein
MGKQGVAIIYFTSVSANTRQSNTALKINGDLYTRHISPMFGTEGITFNIGSTGLPYNTIYTNKLNIGNIQLTTTGSTVTTIGSTFSPNVDNVYSLGSGSVRWAQVFAANGTIQTSDLAQKNSIAQTDLGLDFINSLTPVSYKMKSEPEGPHHHGLIAQDVKEVLQRKGYPLSYFGGLHDGPNMGLNYSEFIGPLVKSIQELDQQKLLLVQKILLQQQEIDTLKIDNQQLKNMIVNLHTVLGLPAPQ